MQRDVPAVSVGVRAVDVGYFNVKYTLGRKLVSGANKIATGLFPALAPRITTKAVMKDAGVDACIVNVGGADYIVGPGAVNYTSSSEQQAFDLDYSVSDRYHALMVGALNYMAEDARAGQEFTINRLVLGLPMNTFHENVKALTRRAAGEHMIRHPGSDQHRRVTVRDVHVMVQPHGALLAFGVANPAALRDDKRTLVVDPGGGTLDWFVARGTTPNWAQSGAHPKAMLHCAYAIADLINPRWRTQYEIVEVIDAALRSGAERFQVGPRAFYLREFRAAIDSVIQESVKHMEEKTGSLDSISRILFAGGGAPVFQEYLLRQKPELGVIAHTDAEPVFSNVRGFQITGEVLERGRAS